MFQSDPGFRQQVIDSTLERMPVIGPQISGSIGTLTGSGIALAVGVLGALWTGLGVTLAIGGALDRIWGVPAVERGGFVSSRLRGLLVLVLAGIVSVGATATVAIATSGGLGGTALDVVGVLASLMFDLVLFTASFRVLTNAPVTTREVLPGALLASGCWLILQIAGGVFVTKVLAGSSQTYGAFAAVVGLLSWLLIAAELLLVAAELNVVLALRLWPRSLTGELLDADRRALRAVASTRQTDRRQQIAVTFKESSADADADASPPSSRHDDAG